MALWRKVTKREEETEEEEETKATATLSDTGNDKRRGNNARGPYLAVPRYLGVGTRHLYSRAHACASKIRDIAFRPPSPPPLPRVGGGGGGGTWTPRFRVTTVHGNEKFPGSRWTPVKYRARPRRGWKWIVFTGRGWEGSKLPVLDNSADSTRMLDVFRSIWSDNNRRPGYRNGYISRMYSV